MWSLGRLRRDGAMSLIRLSDNLTEIPSNALTGSMLYLAYSMRA